MPDPYVDQQALLVIAIFVLKSLCYLLFIKQVLFHTLREICAKIDISHLDIEKGMNCNLSFTVISVRNVQKALQSAYVIQKRGEKKIKTLTSHPRVYFQQIEFSVNYTSNRTVLNTSEK